MTIGRKTLKPPAALANWAEFLKFARMHQAPQWVFRGHSQTWPMKPSVGRADAYDPAKELQIFNEFKRMASPFVQNLQPRDDWDWLFLAQHHGLPTRLLDWTTNPLIACYFACKPSPRDRKAGEVIAVRVSDVGLIGDDARSVGPFSITETKFLYPTVIAPRIAAQRGLFSVHAQPSKNWILKNKTDRLSIAAGDKSTFLRYLHGLGVDAAMVMADMDGLAANLAWRYGSGRPIQ